MRCSWISRRVRDLFNGAKIVKPIGTGSTADAVRNELATGRPTGGTFHSDKAGQYIKALKNWLNDKLSASQYDKLAAQSLQCDLESALKGD